MHLSYDFAFWVIYSGCEYAGRFSRYVLVDRRCGLLI